VTWDAEQSKPGSVGPTISAYRSARGSARMLNSMIISRPTVAEAEKISC